MRATHNSPRDERRVQFPIEDDEDRFGLRCVDPGRGGYIADLEGWEQDVIRRYQPFRRRYMMRRQTENGVEETHALGLLRDINDVDKHRRLTKVIFPPTSFVKADIAVGLIADAHIRMSREQHRGAMIAGLVDENSSLFWAQMNWSNNDEIEHAGYIVPEIAFADGTNPIEMLNGVAPVIVELIREFDPVAG